MIEAASPLAWRDLIVGRRRRPILRADSGQLAAGRIHALIGPNGSGKTTLLRTWLGLLPPVRGTVDLGRGLVRALVPQRFELPPGTPTSVLDLLRSGARRRSQRARAHLQAALEPVGLEGFGERAFRELSGGEARRVLVARALISAPEVLALDEPTTGVDRASSDAIWELLARFSQQPGRLVIATTHERQRAEANGAALWSTGDGALQPVPSP